MKKGIFICQLVTVILFLVFLVLPLFQDVTSVFTLEKLKGENRALAEKPKMDLMRLDKFPPQFTAFYNDHFPLRSFFFQFDYRVFIRKSPIKQVIIGKNDWLFSGGKELKIYQGLMPYSEEDLKSAVQKLEARKKKYEEMGIKFYLAIAPTAYEIYPENLPLYILRINKTMTDAFCEALQNSDVPFIYLKEALLKNKSAGQLYHKYDTHWNELGACFASNATVNLIKKDFPEIPAYTHSDFKLIPKFDKKGNLINMLGDNYKELFDEGVRYDVKLQDSSKEWYYVEKANYPVPDKFPYPCDYEIVAETSLKELPNILIIRDSFFNAARPFFFNSFSRTVAIFDAWKFGENMDVILNENPQIVLLFMYETQISNLL